MRSRSCTAARARSSPGGSRLDEAGRRPPGPNSVGRARVDRTTRRALAARPCTELVVLHVYVVENSDRHVRGDRGVPVSPRAVGTAVWSLHCRLQAAEWGLSPPGGAGGPAALQQSPWRARWWCRTVLVYLHGVMHDRRWCSARSRPGGLVSRCYGPDPRGRGCEC